MIPTRPSHALLSKNILLDDFEKKILEKPSYINQKSQKWDRVYVEGKWDSSKQILIDNVIRRGIAGYKALYNQS